MIEPRSTITYESTTTASNATGTTNTLAYLYKQRDNDDFETILNELDDSIRRKEENLAFIKQREKRAIVYFTSYSILIWLIYALLWYFGALDWTSSYSFDDSHDNAEGGDVINEDILARIAKTVPVGAIPILIFFTRRIVKSWYTRKQNAENKHLTVLRKKQKDQIDKLKKLSNYDKITEMLERHGQAPPRASFGGALPGTPARQTGSGSKVPGSAYSTPIGGGAKTPFGIGSGQMQHLTPAQQRAIVTSQQKGQPLPPNLQAALMASAQKSSLQGQKQAPLGGKRMFPPPPPGISSFNPAGGMDGALDVNSMTPPNQPKTFIDKIADALLGGDEQSPASKYALICQKCFSHNGLCLKDEVMDVQFVCPRCGHFNPSRRARMTGSSGLSRPSSGQGVRAQDMTTSKDGDESMGGADESMSLSSPTTHVHAMLKEAKKGEERDQDENEMSMDEDDNKDAVGGDTLTSDMNVDERREKLRRRTSKKNGRDADVDL